jgi:lipid-binding SYLF domain-containing protein
MIGRSRLHKSTLATAATLIGLALPSISLAQTMEKLQGRVHKAAEVLNILMSDEESRIPVPMLQESRCVAIIPQVIKIGFIMGFQGGKGLVSCRFGSGWSRPSYIELGGVSLGLQMGAKATDFVLLFVRANAPEQLSKDNVTLGADASVALGPVAKTVEESTDLELKRDVYSYSRIRGIFVGISMDGAVVRVHDDANRMAYSDETEVTGLFESTADSAPPMLKEFINALEKWAPAAEE